MKTIKSVIFLFLVLIIASTHTFAQNIHEAAKEGDFDDVRTLLGKKPQLLNKRDGNIRTALHWASLYGHKDIVIYLLENGAEIDPKDYLGCTPLHFAAERDHIDIIKLLIDKGAEVDTQNNIGLTPLIRMAYYSGDTEICRLFIENGADINLRARPGTTPLSVANSQGKKGMVNLLLEKGARLPKENNEIIEFLYYSAFHGHKKLFEQIIAKGGNIHGKNFHNGTHLHSAARGGSVEMVKMLLNKNMAINEKDKYGFTALHCAASAGYKEIIEILITNGADLDKRTLEGKTALHYAEDGGYKGIIELLIEKGAEKSPVKFPVLQGEYLGQKLPGTKPELFAAGIISTAVREHSTPVFSPGGKEIYWVPYEYGKVMFMKQKNGQWTPPRPAPFASEYGDDEPMFSPDGKKLFFLSFRPVENTGKRGKENIWFVEKTGTGWSEPKLMDSTINSKPLHFKASVTHNGTLYYGALFDIYRAELVNGKYQEPERLDNAINTDAYEYSPYISPDESYIIFSRPSGLYISYRLKNGAWTKAKDMGLRGNLPVVSFDGKYLFWGGYEEGPKDIYWMDAKIIDELKPEELK